MEFAEAKCVLVGFMSNDSARGKDFRCQLRLASETGVQRGQVFSKVLGEFCEEVCGAAASDTGPLGLTQNAWKKD